MTDGTPPAVDDDGYPVAVEPAAPRQPRSGFRTMTITGDGLVHLLEAITAGEIKIAGPGIPNGASCARVRVVGRTIEIDVVHHRWPEEIGPDDPIEPLYVRRLGNRGDPSDWGAPIGLDR